MPIPDSEVMGSRPAGGMSDDEVMGTGDMLADMSAKKRASLATGFGDPIVGTAQLARHLPDGLPGPLAGIKPTLDLGYQALAALGIMPEGTIDTYAGKREEDLKKVRGDAGGFDIDRLLGNLANPISYAGGGAVKGAEAAAPLLSRMATTAGKGAATGAVAGAEQPVSDAKNFGSEKAKQVGVGTAAGSAIGGAASAPGVDSALMAALHLKTGQPHHVIQSVLGALRGIIGRDAGKASAGSRVLTPEMVPAATDVYTVNKAGASGEEK